MRVLPWKIEAAKALQQVNHQQALEAAKLSCAAYAGPDEFGKLVQQEFEFVEAEDTQVYVVGVDSVKVSIRGTTNWNDWRTNLDFTKTCRIWLPGRVHDGFCCGYECVADRLRSTIGDRPIDYITGHSLGGGVSPIAAHDLNLTSVPIPVYSFGAPRTGDYEFAAKANCKVWRYVRSGDIVPNVPPSHWGYSHFSPMFFFDRNGRMVESPSVTYRLIDWAINKWRNIGKKGLAELIGHDSSAYVESLRKLVDSEK